MDSFLKSVTEIVEKDAPVGKSPQTMAEVKVEEEEVQEEEQGDEELQRQLVELEMWGKQKRWNDIEFVHRLRNMRS